MKSATMLNVTEVGAPPWVETTKPMTMSMIGIIASPPIETR